MTKRSLSCLAILLVIAFCTQTHRSFAQTQAWPDRIVRLVVPFAAGGPTDFVARIVADQLSKIWGRQVVVENRAGAGTNIGTEIVARSDPDGYTMLFATSSLAVNRSLYRSLGYDPIGLDPLIARTGIPAPLLQAQLLELELAGQVARLPGGLFQRLAAA